MKIPRTIKVGIREYKITQDSKYINPDLWGEVDYLKRTIYLKPDQLEEEKPITLIHEILHTVFYAIGRHKLKADEGLIDALSVLFYQIVKDNPGFMDYLRESL